MQKKTIIFVTLVFLVHGFLLVSTSHAQAQSESNLYPSMAPLNQYLMDKDSEIALARTAAPKSVSHAAEVLVLGKDGYTTAVKGSNGFICLVERSWGNPTDAPEFWNPKMRAPHCFNPQAARTFLRIFLFKTKLVLAGKSPAEIGPAIASALDKKELPPLEPGAMCYMMSKQQYLNDTGKNWHPHLMFFVTGDEAKTWGANLPDSPLLAVNDPEERATIFLLPLPTWSDGTAGPPVDQ